MLMPRYCLIVTGPFVLLRKRTAALKYSILHLSNFFVVPININVWHQLAVNWLYN